MKAKGKSTSAPRSAKRAGRRAADPFQAREASRYDEPLPSREFILQVLEAEAVPVDERALAQLVGVKRHEAEGFARRLAAMERDGQILRNRKGAILVAQKVDVVRGRIEAHPDGFGFLAPDDGSADLYLPPGEMKQVLHGDPVLAQPSGYDRRGRREGAHRRSRGARPLAHRRPAARRARRRVRRRRGSADQHNILIEPGATAGAKPGQVVTAEIVVQPGRQTPADRSRGRGARRRTTTRAWRSRSRCASTSCRSSSRPGRRGSRRASRAMVRPADVAGRDRPARAAVRDDRRRDREGLRRRRALREGRPGLPAARGDRGRQPLRAAGRCARPGGARARQFGVLPAPRDSDAAGEAFERVVLAQPGRGSAVRWSAT